MKRIRRCCVLAQAPFFTGYSDFRAGAMTNSDKMPARRFDAAA
jgi:hypothetical protein